MKSYNILSIIIIFLFVFSINSQAQIIKKPKIGLKQEGKNLLNKIGKKDDQADKPAEEVSEKNRPTESGGKKLKPPDVKSNIDEALKAYDSKSYGESRFAMEQALMGVELEIGYKILESMPKSVDGMEFEESEDEVVSTGYGFAGLVVGRKYYGDESSVEATVINNSMALANVNMVVSNPSMVSYEENQKLVTVQDHRALLEYDEYSGFKLTVPLGQSTGFMLNCVNYESEDDVIGAADAFDLAIIMDLLGEK